MQTKLLKIVEDSLESFKKSDSVEDLAEAFISLLVLVCHRDKAVMRLVKKQLPYVTKHMQHFA
jgi:phosphate uptake regulator